MNVQSCIYTYYNQLVSSKKHHGGPSEQTRGGRFLLSKFERRIALSVSSGVWNPSASIPHVFYSVKTNHGQKFTWRAFVFGDIEPILITFQFLLLILLDLQIRFCQRFEYGSQLFIHLSILLHLLFESLQFFWTGFPVTYGQKHIHNQLFNE